jgi:Kef-type K+ transport system membrane component KefB
VIDATTQFIIGLFLLVASGVLVGELFTHFGQAALVGQLLVGVVLGPSLLGPALGLSSVTAEFSGLQTLATFFILLIAGLSISPKQLRETGLPSTLLGVAIFFVPFLAGAGLVRVVLPGAGAYQDLFIGLAISITALPVLGVMLREFGLLDTTFGVLLMNASVVNELSAVTAFAILLRVSSGATPGPTAIAISIGTVLLFLSTVAAIYALLRTLVARPQLWNRLRRGFHATWNSREAGFALLIVVALGSALYSQFLGLTFILGAFYAGFLITPEVTGPKAHRSITTVLDAVGWGFFIPLFFVLVGYGTNFRDLGTSLVEIAAFVVLAVYAVASKFLVGAGVALGLGHTTEESYLAGFLLTSRGAVELAMAVILESAGIFNETTFTLVAGIGLITTIVSPIGARPLARSVLAAWRRERRSVTPPPAWTEAYSLPPPPDNARPPLPEPTRWDPPR